MVPKTERVELRLDAELLARIDGWRSEDSGLPSRSEAIRRLIENGLTPPSRESVHLSDGDKLILSMLMDISKSLKVKGDVNRELVAESIYGGHLWALKWELPGLFHDDADDPSDVRFVVEVLDMWSLMEEAYEKLSKKDRDRIAKEAEPFGKNVRFTGFDGNNEASLLGIANFFPSVMDRFTRFKGRDLNSHVPMSGSYQRMLRLFEPIRPTLVGGGLSADQIIKLLNAKNAE